MNVVGTAWGGEIGLMPPKPVFAHRNGLAA